MSKKITNQSTAFEMLYPAIFRNLTVIEQKTIRFIIQDAYAADLAFWTSITVDRRGVDHGIRETGFADDHPTDRSLVFRIYLQPVLRLRGFIK